MPFLILIVAVARNGVIGREQNLPWRLSADLQRFKRLTTNHWLLMGRKTFESLPKVLPNRQSIVLTSDLNFGIDNPSCHVAHDLDQALKLPPLDAQLFVIGGASLYLQTSKRADSIWLTHVLADINGDTNLAPFDLTGMQLASEEYRPADANNDFPTLTQNWLRHDGS